MADILENERIRGRVNAMYKEFVSEVDPKDVLDLLIQKRIVNIERKEEVMSEKTKSDRCRTLLDYLISSSNKGAFIILKQALQEHYPWIVERIDTTETTDTTEATDTTDGPSRESVEQLKNYAIVIGTDDMDNDYYDDNDYDNDDDDGDDDDNDDDYYYDGGGVDDEDNDEDDDDVDGRDDDNVYDCPNEVIKINLSRKEQASNLQPIPAIVRRKAAAIVYCNSIFVTGMGNNWDEIWKFDTTSFKWNQCASMVEGRMNHSMASDDGVIYIIGGYLDKAAAGVFSEVEGYDTIHDKCKVFGKLKHAVYGSGNCVSYNGSLYIFGGIDADDKKSNRIQVFDTNSNNCSILSTPMPKVSGFLRAVLWKNSVILLGRFGCFIYNFDTDSWEKRTRFKTGVDHFGAIAKHGKIFVIGGSGPDKDTKSDYRCKVRWVLIERIIRDKPIEWKHHSSFVSFCKCKTNIIA